MFKVVYNNRIGAHTVRDVKKANVYLHSDGVVFNTPEYWPTRELAQAVLNKYQPEHVWEHGDVFESSAGVTMIFLTPLTGDEVRSVSCRCTGTCEPIDFLPNATFLFNIKSKL